MGVPPLLQPVLIAVLASAALASGLTAQEGASAEQRLTIEIRAVVAITVSGDPGPLVIHTATPGNSTLTVSDRSTRYSVVTNIDNVKISACIDQPVPEGTHLLLALASERGLSHGNVDISNARTPVNLVSAIARGAERDQGISYTFTADASVGEIPQQSRTVTLTLTD